MDNINVGLQEEAKVEENLVMDSSSKKAKVFKFVAAGVITLFVVMVLIATFCPMFSTSAKASALGVTSKATESGYSLFDFFKACSVDTSNYFGTEGYLEIANILPAVFSIIFIFADLAIVITCLVFMGLQAYKYFTKKSDNLNFKKYFGYVLAAHLTTLLVVGFNVANLDLVLESNGVTLASEAVSFVSPFNIVIIVLGVGYIIYDLVIQMMEKTLILIKIKRCLASATIIAVILLFVSLLNTGLSAVGSSTKIASEYTVTLNPFAYLSTTVGYIAEKYANVGYTLTAAESSIFKTATVLILCGFILVGAFATYVVFAFKDNTKSHIVKMAVTAVIILVSICMAIFADLRDATVLNEAMGVDGLTANPYGSNGAYFTFVFGIVAFILSFVQFSYSRRDERYAK